MLRVPFFAALCLVSLALAPARAQQPLPTERIDSVFHDLNQNDRPGCSMAVFRGGTIAYARGYGMANLEYDIALTPQSVFHVASISKQFTAFAVELLVSEGLVSWDDDIRKYVPELPDYGKTITLRHLAHHTSGVRDQWNLLSMAGWRWEADLVTQQDALDIIARQRALNFDPGERYLYSHSGFTLLAAVVQEVSGRTLREFTEERIFAPLGMTSTHFHDDHQTIVPDRAYGYRRDGRTGWKISIPDFAIVGASSLFTTVEDMARWDGNFRDHVVGDDALFERFLSKGVLTSGEELTYAHGIAVSQYRGIRTIGHGGADAGYRSDYIRFPEHDLGIVTFCNFAAAGPGRYTRSVADVLLDDVLTPVAENADPEVDVDRWGETFERMRGYYSDPQTDRPLFVYIFRRHGRLARGSGSGGRGTTLVPLAENRFQLGTGREVAELDIAEGKPRAITIDGRRFPYAGRAPDNIELREYVGTYWSDELGTEYRITADTAASRLRLVHRKQQPRVLRAAFTDTFSAGGDWFTFSRAPDGRVAGFTWSSGRVWKVRFTKR
jgi:CubicO group peptidase (beta-lactamase class C family)